MPNCARHCNDIKKLPRGNRRAADAQPSPHQLKPGRISEVAAPGTEDAPKYALWRNPEKSLNSMGEPCSAWASELKSGKWFVVWTDPDRGRADQLADSKPEGYTECHLVGAECLDEDKSWDLPLDFFRATSGRIRSVSVGDLKAA